MSPRRSRVSWRVLERSIRARDGTKKERRRESFLRAKCPKFIPDELACLACHFWSILCSPNPSALDSEAEDLIRAGSDSTHHLVSPRRQQTAGQDHRRRSHQHVSRVEAA